MANTMKAAVFVKPEQIVVKEVPIPVIDENEVLIIKEDGLWVPVFIRELSW